MLEQSVRGSQRDVCEVYARRIAFSGDETVRVAVGLAAYEYARHLRASSCTEMCYAVERPPPEIQRLQRSATGCDFIYSFRYSSSTQSFQRAAKNRRIPFQNMVAGLGRGKGASRGRS